LASSTARGNDLNIDTLFALYASDGYGDSLADPRALSTFWCLLREFITEYPLNAVDATRGLGVSLGRYPFDMYDGDMSDGINQGHPWFISTLLAASYAYRLATLAAAGPIPKPQDLGRKLFNSMGLTDGEMDSLAGAGNKQAALVKIVAFADKQVLTARFHSDNRHLSEQYDRDQGFMKSVRDLSWSYKEYLTAWREAQAAYVAVGLATAGEDRPWNQRLAT
jgi:glucoamylase